MLRFLGCAVNQGRFTAPEVDMNGKHVLITGTSIGGIGYETALGLAVSACAMSCVVSPGNRG